MIRSEVWLSPSQRVSAYRIASAIVEFPETVASWASSQDLSASMIGLLRENRFVKISLLFAQALQDWILSDVTPI
jgi:hypothetical protein